MTVYATAENLLVVQQAITDLVSGKRQVKVEYTTPQGSKNSMQYTEVSLSELRVLEQQMRNELTPMPLMESVDVEVQF